MTDTVRTRSAFLTALFQDGQAAGSITPQDMRDLIVSVDFIADAIAAARLGTGTPGATNWLRGDGAWTGILDSDVGDVAPFTIASPGATPAVVWTAARRQQVMTLTTNATVTVSGIPAGGALLVRVIQAASGGPYTLGHAVSGLGTLFWDNNTTLTMSTGASKFDDYLYRYDGTRTDVARIRTGVG